MKITERNNHTWTHIEKTHESTHNKGKSHRHQKGMKTHQKGKRNWKRFVFYVHCFSYFWGFLPQKEAKRKEARAHFICTNRGRKKKLDTLENHRKKTTAREHTWKRHTSQHTTKGKQIKKAWKHTKRENAIENVLSFMFTGFLTFGDFSHVKRHSTKRREHMSSAQTDVAKRN